MDHQPTQFSSLATTAGDDSLEHDAQNVPSYRQIWTAVSLVSGTAVGAGILAIASVSLKPGFIPSSITLGGCWVLMACVGLIIAEITCNIAIRDRDAKDFGIISITERIFGVNIARGIGILYVAFHYTLLIAYIAEAGRILSAVTHLPTLAGPVIFTTCMGSFIACSSVDTVSMLNNCLFIVVVMAFLGLVCMGVGSITLSNLSYQDYSEVGPTVPILLVALVFHNIIPTICAGLLYHRRSICVAIFIGSSIPLCMFLLWNAVILGLVNDYRNTAHSSALIDPVHILLGDHSAHDGGFGTALITLFSEAAIITSFIGFVIGLMEFYADTLPGRSKKDTFLYILVLVPPMLVALGNPGIFLRALDAAGAYGISVLFGLLPVALTMRLRSEALKDDTAVFAAMSRTDTSNVLHTPVSTEQSADESDSTRSSGPFSPVVAGRIAALSRRHGVGSAAGNPAEIADPEDGSSRHAAGVQLRVLEQRGLIATNDASSDSNSVGFGADSPHGESWDGMDGSTHTGKFNPTDNIEYVYFLPGGDGALFFMAAVFVGIIVLKLAFG